MADLVNTGAPKDLIEGRGGVKLPNASWLESDLLNRHSFVQFFRNLLEANGLDCSMESKWDGFKHVERTFSHELAVPAFGPQPLTLIRGSYENRPEVDVEYDRKRALDQSQWGQTRSTTVGTERYGLLIPPTTLGPLISIISVSYPHERGGTGYDDQDATDLNWHEGAFRPQPYDKEAQEDYQTHRLIQEAAERAWLKNVGQKTLELLQ